MAMTLPVTICRNVLSAGFLSLLGCAAAVPTAQEHPGDGSTMGADPGTWTAALTAARERSRECGTEEFSPAPAASWNERLATAAREHSRDMAATGRLGHTGSGGETLRDRIESAGYQPRAWGENVAFGHRDVASVVDGWLDSPGHCANIMNGDFQEFGAAVKTAEDGSPYWTLVLAAPAE